MNRLSASTKPVALPAGLGWFRSVVPAPAMRVSLRHACPIIRAGLRAILSLHREFNVVAEGSEADPATPCCVALTDYADGLQAARYGACGASILILTARDTETDIRRAMESGVSGYMLLGCSEQELIAGVRTVGRGHAYMSAVATERYIASPRRAALTRREYDVLRALARGGSDKVIARELGIGSGTVKSHVKHLLQKLDATARTHAVVVAMRRGLLSERN